MKNWKRILQIALVPICLVAIISGAVWVNSITKSKKEIVVSSEYKYANIVFNVMENKKLFQKHLPSGYKVRYVEIAGFANKRDALAARQIHFMSSSRASMIPAKENGFPLALVNSGGISGHGIYSRNPNIKTVQDLANSTNEILMRSMGGTTEMIMKMMAEEKLGNKDAFKGQYRAMGLDYAEMLEIAAVNNSFDAVELMFPYDLQAVERGFHLVYDLRPLMDANGVISDILTHVDMVNKNWKVVDAFLKAQAEAIDIIINRTDEIIDFLVELYKIDEKYIRQQIKMYPPFLEVSGYNEAADMLLTNGTLKTPATRFEDLFNYDRIPKQSIK